MVRIYDGFLELLAAAAAALLLAITIGIGLDVGARYLLNSPIGWMSEFVQHSMLLILFLSVGWLTRERGHVAVEILLDGLPRQFRRAMEIFAGLLAAAVSAFLCFWAGASVWDNYSRGVLTDGIYPLPRWWLIAIIALGLFLTTVEFLRHCRKMMADPNVDMRQVDSELDALALAARTKTEREQAL